MMQECRSSSISLNFKAYAAAFWAEVTEALRCCSWPEKRMRTSKGSAMAMEILAAEAAASTLMAKLSPEALRAKPSRVFFYITSHFPSHLSEEPATFGIHGD